MSSLNLFAARLLAGAAIVVLIWLMLAPKLPAGTGSIPDWLAHIIAFAVITLALWTWATRTSLLLIGGLALALGGAIEVIQPHVGRTASWSDLGADLIGVVLCLAVLALWRRRQGISG